MPPKKLPANDPAHRHSAQAPRAQRKSKPKFEVPNEPASSAAPVEWVYRTDDVPAAAPPSPPARPPAAHSGRQTETRSKTNLFFAIGMAPFVIGAKAVRLATVVPLGLASAPFRIATAFFSRKPGR